MTQHVLPVVWRPPLSLGAPHVEMRTAGQSIAEIVDSIADLPASFHVYGDVCINGEIIPRFDRNGVYLWPLIRPRPTSVELPIVVTLHLAGRGGKSGSGSGAKAIGGLVAALALVVLTAGAAGGFFATAGGLFTAGSTSAHILAGVIGIGGALAISALSAPPAVADKATPIAALGATDNTDNKEAAAASGNTIAKGGAIPRVIGTRKVFPALCGEPIIELVGDDEYVEALYGLNGPHLWNDIRVDGVTIADAADISFETREGWSSDSNLTLTVRQGRTLTPQVELSIHKVDPSNQGNLLDATNPTADLPIWHRVVTRASPDEAWLHLLLPNGVSVNGSTSTDIAIPFRVRIRQRGDVSWIQLPEIHISDSTLSQRRRAIILKWQAGGVDRSVPPSKSGVVLAFLSATGQSVAPSTSAWVADSSFDKGSGDNYYDATNGPTTRLKNVDLYSNRVEFFLDPATIPRGIYEIEVMRGMAYQSSSFAASSYQYSGTVKDFFYYSSTTTPAVVMSRANLADRVVLQRAASIWNEYPVGEIGKLALLAVKARNRTVQNVSALASGYVKDWDGSGWNTWTTTSIPAAHYADILSGAQNLDPLPVDLRDDTGLVAWRTLCIANDWTCDAIIDDLRTQDALSLLASCGYARPYQSDIYGVVVDKDRSGDAPTQVWSRRNANNVRYERAFPRVPDGFIVNFRNVDNDYDDDQTVVYQRDRSVGVPGLLETISYDGLVTEAKVIARAQFDLDQANQRATFYYLDTDIEAIVCRRNDLVALQNDILSTRAGDGILKKKFLSGGNITGITLDSTVNVTTVADMHATADMHGVTDMHDVGFTTGFAVRRNDGTVSAHQVANASGETDTLTLSTPLADPGTWVGLDESDGTYGCLVVVGRLTSEYKRCLVQAIAPSKELNASITLVDEAPALVRYAP